MGALTVAQLNNVWPCLPEANRAAYELSQFFLFGLPIMPEYFVKGTFEAYYGENYMPYYEAWFEMSAAEIVCVDLDGEEYCGINTAIGFAQLVYACKMTGGCVETNPCECPEFFWQNKPNNPCP